MNSIRNEELKGRMAMNQKLERILKDFKEELIADKEVTGLAAITDGDCLKVKYYGAGTAEGLGALLAILLDKLAEDFEDADSCGDEVSDAFYETLEDLDWRRRKQ